MRSQRQQTPFEKCFYQHLQNVQLSLKELNDNIRSRKKVNPTSNQFENEKEVEVSNWQNQISDSNTSTPIPTPTTNTAKLTQKKSIHRYSQNISSSNQNRTLKQRLLFMLQDQEFLNRLIFLLVVWTLGIIFIARTKQITKVNMSKSDFDNLINSISNKDYLSIHIPTHDLDQMNNTLKLSFEDYCDLARLPWLKELRPHYRFLIESHLNSLYQIKDGQSKQLGIFDQNNIFLNFFAFDLKNNQNIFSFNLRITYIQYDYEILMRLSQKYFNKILKDNKNNNHFYLQQDKDILEFIQNAIHDFVE